MLKRVVYGAGDISQNEFAQQWQSLRKLQDVQYTFNVSNDDLALRLSRILHQIPRLGDARAPLMIPDGASTVDATSVMGSRFEIFGHSYLYASPEVGADIGSWIDGEQSPLQRGLQQITYEGKTYYVFR